MKTIIVAMYDVKVGAFMQPFFQSTRLQAIRSITDSVRKEGTPFNAHPDDFKAFELGEWDEVSGVIKPHDSPQFIIDAIQCVETRQ